MAIKQDKAHNITTSDPGAHLSSDLSIEKVQQALQHWRKHEKKHRADRIPDALWNLIFSLTEHRQQSPKKLRRLLSITKMQYDDTYRRIKGKPNPENKQLPLSKMRLDLHAIVVEYIQPDCSRIRVDVKPRSLPAILESFSWINQKNYPQPLNATQIRMPGDDLND